MKPILLFFSLIYAINTTAQFSNYGYILEDVQYVDNLCFDMEIKESIKVNSQVKTSTLSITDKLRFKKKIYTQNYHNYFNSAGNATTDIKFISHKNMFPQWYAHPIITRKDETGIKSYFEYNSTNIYEGWEGNGGVKTDHGEYIADTKTGEYYYQQPFNLLDGEIYRFHNQKNLTYGFLYKYLFVSPSTKHLAQFQMDGYNVSVSGNIIKVINDQTILIWDTVKKIFVVQSIEGSQVIKTTKINYTYYEKYKAHLISKVVTTTPMTFDNGDCFETVNVTSYTNFESDCTVDIYATRKQQDKTIEELANQLNVFPNPANDRITIEIPQASLESEILITDLNGNAIKSRKAGKDAAQFNINISEFPLGMYLISVQQGEIFYSAKFVKQ